MLVVIDSSKDLSKGPAENVEMGNFEVKLDGREEVQADGIGVGVGHRRDIFAWAY